MAQWQLGREDEAIGSYRLAVEWTKKNAPKDKGLQRRIVEAEELFGLTGELEDNSEDVSDGKGK